jgi:hypothetical protein
MVTAADEYVAGCPYLDGRLDCRRTGRKRISIIEQEGSGRRYWNELLPCECNGNRNWFLAAFLSLFSDMRKLFGMREMQNVECETAEFDKGCDFRRKRWKK